MTPDSPCLVRALSATKRPSARREPADSADIDLLGRLGLSRAARNDGLKGYTGSSVNIQRGGLIYTYNEKGSQTGCTPAR
jgi:hypothetical protein